MSEIRVENIVGETGTDAVKFTKGINVTGVTTATSFSGSGASLTSLPAANLTGTLPAISGANLTGIPQKIKQIKYLVYNTLETTTSSSYIATGISLSMTPTSTSNKLIFSGQIIVGIEKDCTCAFQTYVDNGSGFTVTEEARGPDRNNRTRGTTGQGYFMTLDDEEYQEKAIPLHVVLDIDNTNAHTVKLYWCQPDTSGRTVRINYSVADSNGVWIPSFTSHFTLMEVEMS